MRFAVVGLASVAVDTAVLVVLREAVGVPLWVAASVSFAAALVVNFGLNLRWSFGARGRLGIRLARYAVLVPLNFAITLVLTLELSSAGVPYVLAKWVSIAVAAGVNFVAYRRWVFL